jgi:hypothetical protein
MGMTEETGMALGFRKKKGEEFMNEENFKNDEAQNSSENLSEQPTEQTEQAAEQPTENLSGNLRGNSNATKQLFIWEEKASRLELFIRIAYTILISIVLTFYQLIAGLCLIAQWIIILILGRRNKGLSNIIKGYFEYQIHVVSYVNWITDKRPGILPKKTEIYEKEI